MKMDAIIKTLLRKCLKTEAAWLAEGFDRILRITASRPKSPYGFEWFAHTTFADYLLSQNVTTLSDIQVGTAGSSSKKPDIRFVYKGVPTAIQVKAVVKTSESHAKSDDMKTYEEDQVYSLLVCYPNGLKPNGEMVFICSVAGPRGFLWNLRRIK